MRKPINYVLRIRPRTAISHTITVDSQMPWGLQIRLPGIYGKNLWAQSSASFTANLEKDLHLRFLLYCYK